MDCGNRCDYARIRNENLRQDDFSQIKGDIIEKGQEIANKPGFPTTGEMIFFQLFYRKLKDAESCSLKYFKEICKKVQIESKIEFTVSPNSAITYKKFKQFMGELIKKTPEAEYNKFILLDDRSVIPQLRRDLEKFLFVNYLSLEECFTYASIHPEKIPDKYFEEKFKAYIFWNSQYPQLTKRSLLFNDPNYFTPCRFTEKKRDLKNILFMNGMVQQYASMEGYKGVCRLIFDRKMQKNNPFSEEEQQGKLYEEICREIEVLQGGLSRYPQDMQLAKEENQKLLTQFENIIYEEYPGFKDYEAQFYAYGCCMIYSISKSKLIDYGNDKFNLDKYPSRIEHLKDLIKQLNENIELFKEKTFRPEINKCFSERVPSNILELWEKYWLQGWNLDRKKMIYCYAEQLHWSQSVRLASLRGSSIENFSISRNSINKYIKDALALMEAIGFLQHCRSMERYENGVINLQSAYEDELVVIEELIDQCSEAVSQSIWQELYKRCSDEDVEDPIQWGKDNFHLFLEESISILTDRFEEIKSEVTLVYGSIDLGSDEV